MTRVAKGLAIFVGAVVIMVCGAAIMVAGTVVTSGVMTVSIQQSEPDGVSLYIPLPAGLIEGALAVAPIVLDLVGDHHVDAELDRVRRELDELMPALEAVLDELADMPDAVLVEVEGDGEYVLVRKQGRSIRVLVEEDGGERIAISIPTRVFRSIGSFMVG